MGVTKKWNFAEDDRNYSFFGWSLVFAYASLAICSGFSVYTFLLRHRCDTLDRDEKRQKTLSAYELWWWRFFFSCGRKCCSQQPPPTEERCACVNGFHRMNVRTRMCVCVVAFVKWMMMIVQTVAAERHEYTLIWRTQDCSGELYGFFKMLSALKLSCSAEKQLFDFCWLCKYFLGRNTLCGSFLRKSFKLRQRDCL